MASVVSLGSVNVDHVVRADGDRLAALAERYDWFPAAGETVTVVSVPDEFRTFDADHLLGGKGANQAVAAATAGAAATLLGRVGEDAGEFDVRPTLESRGVDVSGVEAAPGPTGAAYVFVDETGENRIAVVPGANARVDDAYLGRHRDAILAADVLLLQNEIPVGPVDALLADLDGSDDDHRPTVVLDPAPAAGVAPLLAHDCVDLVTPNEHEFEALAEALVGFDGTVVRTRGPAAVLVQLPSGDGFEVTPPAVDPVDTTGAGDVLCGFLAAGLAAGDDLRTAVERAVAAAALSVTGEGVQAATPTREEVRAFRGIE